MLESSASISDFATQPPSPSPSPLLRHRHHHTHTEALVAGDTTRLYRHSLCHHHGTYHHSFTSNSFLHFHEQFCSPPTPLIPDPVHFYVIIPALFASISSPGVSHEAVSCMMSLISTRGEMEFRGGTPWLMDTIVF